MREKLGGTWDYLARLCERLKPTKTNNREENTMPNETRSSVAVAPTTTKEGKRKMRLIYLRRRDLGGEVPNLVRDRLYFNGAGAVKFIREHIAASPFGPSIVKKYSQRASGVPADLLRLNIEEFIVAHFDGARGGQTS